jgi:hypothetical protein
VLSGFRQRQACASCPALGSKSPVHGDKIESRTPSFIPIGLFRRSTQRAHATPTPLDLSTHFRPRGPASPPVVPVTWTRRSATLISEQFASRSCRRAMGAHSVRRRTTEFRVEPGTSLVKPWYTPSQTRDLTL